ncbi:putative haspin protein kinase [Diplodia seriata]|uniref:non-specific serine/threonine protein kinase n=1 Tax=Diplodia seriata TaxID=420778 RepID=A0A0G2DRZ8_9PEZI|nr:putative haspin protein kinase [Diplodia seriata]
MPRVKTTYGKRPKANSAFADFWSSPERAAPNPKPASTDAVDDITTTLGSLDIGEKEKRDKKERAKREKRDRAALQAIDGNAVSPTARSENLSKLKSDHGAIKEPAATVVPKTPQRMKKLLPKKKAAPIEQTPVEQTPQSERKRRRGKRAIPSIRLDDDAATAANGNNTAMDEPANSKALLSSPQSHNYHQKPRSCALSSPSPTRSADLLPAGPTTTTTTQRRSRSPSILVTPRNSSKPSAPSDPLVGHAKPLLRLCADRHGRKAPTPFSQWAAALSPYFSVAKIAEASYGEVYRLSLRDREQAGLSASDESVLKVIALKPPMKKSKTKKRKTKAERLAEEKIEGMSSVESVAGEIRLLRRMAHVPGFTNFRDVRVLKGCPAESFARAWREWNDGREEERRSIFPDPAAQGSYDDDQLWAVIEMQDAGTDLENVRMEDVGGVFGVWDIFWSVALALGKGEEEARFEVSYRRPSDPPSHQQYPFSNNSVDKNQHRDLHMGNICIRPANANRPIAAPSPTTTTTDITPRKLHFTGLESTIIDYTLSRAQLTHPAASPDPDASEIAFLDLETDPALFDGDAEVEYQYEMYRCMRAAMFLDDPRADVEGRWDEALQSGRTWVGFHPQTNLVWLHFILHEMMKQVVEGDDGKARGETKKMTKKKTKTRTTTMKMETGKKKKASGGDGSKTGTRKRTTTVIPNSDDDDDDDDENDVKASPSSSSAIKEEDEEEEASTECAAAFTQQLIAAKRRKLEKILRRVQKLLDPDRWAKSGLFSVKDLVALALEQEWLDEEDVIAVAGGGGSGDEGEGASLLEMVRGMGV